MLYLLNTVHRERAGSSGSVCMHANNTFWLFQCSLRLPLCTGFRPIADERDGCADCAASPPPCRTALYCSPLRPSKANRVRARLPGPP